MTLDLRPIRIPDAPDAWPLPIGWWLIIGVIMLLLLMLLRYWFVQRPRYRAARAALKQLSNLEQLPERQQITALNALLKRAALSYLPRDAVARLQGPEWSEFLQQIDKSFTQTQLHALSHRQYAPHSSRVAVDASFQAAARRWLMALPDHARKLSFSSFSLAQKKVTAPTSAPRENSRHA